MSYSVLHQYGETAFTSAACGGHTETVTLLLDRGADINHKDDVSYCDACMIVLLHYGTVSWYDIWYQSDTNDGRLVHISINIDDYDFITNQLFVVIRLMKERNRNQIRYDIPPGASFSLSCTSHSNLFNIPSTVVAIYWMLLSRVVNVCTFYLPLMNAFQLSLFKSADNL